MPLYHFDDVCVQKCFVYSVGKNRLPDKPVTKMVFNKMLRVKLSLEFKNISDLSGMKGHYHQSGIGNLPWEPGRAQCWTGIIFRELLFYAFF